MTRLCWLLAVFHIFIGIMSIAVPGVVRQWSVWVYLHLHSRVIALFSILLGLILLTEAQQTYFPIFVSFFGGLAFTAGFIYLLIPWPTLEKIDQWWINASDLWRRIYGVVALFFAVAFFIAATGIR